MFFESILLYFAAMLASGCTENQYSTGKEKVVINVHCMNANFLAVGDTTYAYYFSLCYSVFLFVVRVCFLFCFVVFVVLQVFVGQ